MDKKSKFPQSSSKGTAGDAKKNQDVTNSKLFPKTSRKREPTGASSFPKYEQQRKCNVQKAKNFDKRPKPKGQYHGSSKEDTKVVEEDLAEPGLVMVQGSKKQNLNHLLNFHYEPRDMQGGSGSWSHGKVAKGYNRNSNRWLPPVQRHKYNKEQFLQASCQFVVTADEDYSLYLTDPDILVDWKLVEQVKLYNSESLSCPICLYAPVAGKMTRCGHVYCWPCILHYLSLSDKSWRKCPICYESVHKSELKSVVEITQTALNLGDTVTLRLMRREKGTLLATPVGSTMQTPITFLSISDDTKNQMYSKLLIASIKNILDIIECERVQLKLELKDNPDSPENCYIEQALAELQKRKNELLQKEMKTENEVGQPIEHTSDQKLQERETNINPTYNDNNATDEQAMKIADYSSNEVQPASGSQKFFYFYQAEDGQHMYLHAMNVKMLEMQYGSLENCPHLISGKLLEREGGGFTEELRRRLRYLCHLPLTCQFELAEIELKPPLVSEEVLRSFRDQLQLRQKRRQCRERAERKREKKITEEENKRMGKYPTPNVHIESHLHFPEWQPEVLFADDYVSSPPESIAPSSVASSPSLSTFEEIAKATREVENTPESGPSFAEMLRNTGSRFKSNAWPSVTSTYAKPNANTGTQLTKESTRENYEDDYASVPSYSQSFGDALAQALEQTKLLDAGTRADANVNGKKKKKKNKPTVLFATTMARSP